MKRKFRKLLLLGNVILGLMALSAKAAGTTPAISTQPAATLNVAVGASPSPDVTASGTAPLFYQWRKDGAPVGVICYVVVNGRNGTYGTADQRSRHGPSAGPAAAGGPPAVGTDWSWGGARWRFSGMALPLLGEDSDCERWMEEMILSDL